MPNFSQKKRVAREAVQRSTAKHSQVSAQEQEEDILVGEKENVSDDWATGNNQISLNTMAQTIARHPSPANQRQLFTRYVGQQGKSNTFATTLARSIQEVRQQDALSGVEAASVPTATATSSSIQRDWDTSGSEPRYHDATHKVIWHLTSGKELWFETTSEDSPYKAHSGIGNKGSYAKWFMLSAAPFDLIREQADAIEIPAPQELDAQFHPHYKLYVYLMSISTLKWDDIKTKPPFSTANWKVKKVYEHYRKHVNPLIEKEDGGLNAYYGASYKYINPFLRQIRENYGDERYAEIIAGKLGGDSAQLITILDEKRKAAKFPGDVDMETLKNTLAEIRGAKKEMGKKADMEPLDTKHTPTVYRGDFSGLVDIMAKEANFDKTKLDKEGTLDVGKEWTQYQFVSTSVNKQIGAPAHTGTIWNIDLGPRAEGVPGGLYTSEGEILFPPYTTFLIEKIETYDNYAKDKVLGDSNTKYVVFAKQGYK